jgi:hypothetical protein
MEFSLVLYALHVLAYLAILKCAVGAARCCRGLVLCSYAAVEFGSFNAFAVASDVPVLRVRNFMD